MKHSISLALPVLILSFAGILSAQQPTNTDWPQFLGPQRNGISREKGLMKSWPVGGPKILWRVPGGVGMGGVSIAGNRALALVQRNGQQSVIAVNTADGKLIWETPISKAYTNPMGNGPRTTPTISGDLVFAFSGDGVLAALKLADGAAVWSHNVIKEHMGKIADYGMASSPLVAGNMVAVVAGCPRATLVAYQAKTGKPGWSYAQSDHAGYCSPALLKFGDQMQIVSFSGAAAFGLNPANGSAYWRYPFVTDYDCNIATPIQFSSHVFLSAGENHGSVMLRVNTGNEGSVTEIWKSLGRRSVMRNEWQTSILLDGYLYGFDNVGSAGPVSHLTCISAENGKPAWQQTRFGKGNMIAADGKLFISTMKGELVVAKASPEGYQELGRAELLGATRHAPALSQGRLYLRDDREIVCVDAK